LKATFGSFFKIDGTLGLVCSSKYIVFGFGLKRSKNLVRNGGKYGVVITK
jgi:hypothetical protein